jgi:hypothetical protein
VKRHRPVAGAFPIRPYLNTIDGRYLGGSLLRVSFGRCLPRGGRSLQAVTVEHATHRPA